MSTGRRGLFDAVRVPAPSETATAEAKTPMPLDRRSELLDRLADVVLSQGFVGLTLDELAARLRCSKSTLYLLAPSKEQLVAQVARHFFARAAARIEAAVASAPTPRKRLQIYLTSVGREMSRGSTTFHEQMASHPITSELYRRNSQIAADRVRELIHEGVQDGSFHVTNAEFAGHFAAAVIEAIHLDGDAVASRRATADAYSKLTDLMLLGVTGRRGRL
jgi:AcrR family transcriptional regulator